MLSVLRWTTGALRREPMDRPLPADLAARPQHSPAAAPGDAAVPRRRASRALAGAARAPAAARVALALRLRGRCRLRRPSARCSPCARGPSPSRTCWPCRSRARSSRARSTLSWPGASSTTRPRASPPRPVAPRAGLGPEAASPPAGGWTRSSPRRPRPPQTPEDAERAARGLLEKGFRAAGDRGPAGRRRPLPRGAWTPPAARDDPGARGRVPALGREALHLAARDGGRTTWSCATRSPRTTAGRAWRRARSSSCGSSLSADSGHAGAWRDLGELEAGETRRVAERRRSAVVGVLAPARPRSRSPAPGRRRGRRPRSPCRTGQG